MFHGCFKDVFQACYEEVARIFQECFNGIGKKVSEVLPGSFKTFSGEFQPYVKSVSKKI